MNKRRLPEGMPQVYHEYKGTADGTGVQTGKSDEGNIIGEIVNVNALK